MVYGVLLIVYTLFLLYLYVKSKETPIGFALGIGRLDSIRCTGIKVGLYLLNKMKYSCKTRFDKKLQSKLIELYGLNSSKCDIVQYRAQQVARYLIFVGALLGLLWAVQLPDQLKLGHSGDTKPAYISQLQRPRFGEGNKTFALEAEVACEDIQFREQCELTLHELPPQNDDQAVRRVYELLTEDLVKGKNTDLQHVESKLHLISHNPYLENLGVKLVWTSTNESIVTKSGEVNRFRGERSPVELQVAARISKGHARLEKSFNIRILPIPEKNREEAIEEHRGSLRQMVDEIKSAMQDGEETIQLPQRIGSSTIRWSIPAVGQVEATKAYEPLIFIAFAMVVFEFYLGYRIKKKIEKRKLEIKIAFPEFVNSFIILLNAGLTVRRAVERIVKDSPQKRNAFYTELTALLRAIEAGKSEQQAFEDLAERCRLPLISRFVSVLLQNIKRGNSDLTTYLEGLSRECWEERKNTVKRLGEEASTKLLLPMMLMLLAVLIITAAPAAMAMNIL